MRDMAQAIGGERLSLPARSITADEASPHFGWAAHFAALELPARRWRQRKSVDSGVEGDDVGPHCHP